MSDREGKLSFRDDFVFSISIQDFDTIVSF